MQGFIRLGFGLCSEAPGPLIGMKAAGDPEILWRKPQRPESFKESKDW